MSEKSFTLTIVTPEREVFRGQVVSVVAPGSEGSFGVLAHHAPLISGIEVGVLSFRLPDGEGALVALGGGFAEVKGNEMTVLVASAEQAGEIDVARAEAAKQRAERRLAERETQTDKPRAKLALQRALTRLRVAGEK
ncbi:MAG: F0F1 ATP synthase subunit epsilon [bacterium]